MPGRILAELRHADPTTYAALLTRTVDEMNTLAPTLKEACDKAGLCPNVDKTKIMEVDLGPMHDTNVVIDGKVVGAGRDLQPSRLNGYLTWRLRHRNTPPYWARTNGSR